jgi:hypothetical protein
MAGWSSGIVQRRLSPVGRQTVADRQHRRGRKRTEVWSICSNGRRQPWFPAFIAGRGPCLPKIQGAEDWTTACKLRPALTPVLWFYQSGHKGFVKKRGRKEARVKTARAALTIAGRAAPGSLLSRTRFPPKPQTGVPSTRTLRAGVEIQIRCVGGAPTTFVQFVPRTYSTATGCRPRGGTALRRS